MADAENLQENPQLEKFRRLMNDPSVQKYLNVATDPQIAEGISALSTHPARIDLMYWEGGLIVFMLIFRAWRFSKSRHWFAKLWTRLWTTAMGFGLGTFVVPAWILGDTYTGTLKRIWELISILHQ